MNLLSFFISLFILIFPYFMWYKLHKELKSYNDIVPYFAHIDKDVGISFIPVTLGNKYNYLNDIQKILE